MGLSNQSSTGGLVDVSGLAQQGGDDQWSFASTFDELEYVFYYVMFSVAFFVGVVMHMHRWVACMLQQSCMTFSDFPFSGLSLLTFLTKDCQFLLHSHTALRCQWPSILLGSFFCSVQRT